MIVFYATTGRVELPYAHEWSPAQWAFMAEQARINPGLVGTVTASGILKLAPSGIAGVKFTEYEVAIQLGSAWTSGVTNLGGTVTLEPGEVQTPEGVIGPEYIPPTISGPIPPSPSTTGISGTTTIQPPEVVTVSQSPSATQTAMPGGTAQTQPPTVTVVPSPATSPMPQPTSTLQAPKPDMMIWVIVGAIVLAVVVYAARK